MENQHEIITAITRLTVMVEGLSRKMDELATVDRRVTILETRLAESEKWLNAIKWLIGVFGLGLAAIFVQVFAK